jgi:hypothetical protein
MTYRSCVFLTFGDRSGGQGGDEEAGEMHGGKMWRKRDKVGRVN